MHGLFCSLAFVSSGFLLVPAVQLLSGSLGPNSAPASTPAPTPAPSSTLTASASPKTSAGTTDPEEATRLLAEKAAGPRAERRRRGETGEGEGLRAME